MTFMDNYSTHIIRWLKQTNTYVQLSEDLSSSTTSESPMPTTSITFCTQYPSRWIFQHRWHIQILPTNHIISSTVTQNWMRIWKPVTTWKPIISVKPITLLGRCTRMANRHNYHKRYMGNQAMCKPTNTGTDQTTGDSSPCHIYPVCHKICHPSK